MIKALIITWLLVECLLYAAISLAVLDVDIFSWHIAARSLFALVSLIWTLVGIVKICEV